MLRRIWWTGFFVLVGIAVLCSNSRLADQADLAVLDSQYKLLATYFKKHVAREVVVVGIDEDTLKSFPEPLALWHPYFAQFLGAMAVARPAVVGLDVVFPDRSYDHLVPGYDKLLLEGLLAARKSTQVVLGVTVDQSGKPHTIYPPFSSVAGNDSMGYVLLPLDSDNLVREASEHIGENGRTVPTLVGQMVRKMGMEPTAGKIDYALGAQQSYVPLQQVLKWSSAGDKSRLTATFADRPVLLGSVLRFEDRFFQPVNLAGWENDNGMNVPGVLIHAQMLKSMLNKSLITPAPIAMVLVLSLLITLLWFIPLRLSITLTLLVVIVIALYATSSVLLYHGMFFGTVGAMITATVTLLGRWVTDSILQMRERRRLRNAFSGYVSPQVMDEILAGRLAGELGGELRRVCIMFADVRGFTTLSESMTPQAVLAMLNRYFEEVTHAIHAEGGTINCIMGDGIMAIFGAPKSMSNPTSHAFRAAQRMLKMLPILNQTLESEGKSPLSIGIGLNVGDAVVGHVGSQLRHDYSAIGDTTNVAARLEGLTKELGYPLVCSKAVVTALEFPEGFVNLGERPIKGRAPVEVYGWREP